MKAMDLTQRKDNLRERLQKAIRDNDAEAFGAVFEEMMQVIGDGIRSDYDERIENAAQEMDRTVLAARGVRQLTSDEKTYYQKLTAAMKSADPKQALNNLDVVMPVTVIDKVFEDLSAEHPLLSHINFEPTTSVIKMIYNANGDEAAVWGELTDAITKEIASGFKEADSGLFKLTAFIPVAKSMLDLGPEWLDRYVREILYEALANGMEAGIVDGTGNKMPIGMTREVGDGVSVTGGVYPRKTKIKVTHLDIGTLGNILSLLAVNENGRPREVTKVILVVNPQDYLQKVKPAVTVMAPDGSYVNVLPYDIEIIPSRALTRGEAVIGLGERYFGAIGMEAGGRIEFDDSVRFIQDQRVYLIKTYANGFPMDNNAFLLLDVSELQPINWKVEMVEDSGSTAAATLSSLRIGALTLTPAFAENTLTYTAATTNASNTITAVPSDAEAEVNITVNDRDVDNGTAATWTDGENTVEIVVTGGTTTKTYTVTVTKS